MTEISDVRYARSGDVSIAYQVDGDGPVDLVFVRGITGGLLSTWERPSFAKHVPGLAENSGLLMLDERGKGPSDRVADLPTLETRMDDVRAVMTRSARRTPSCGAGWREATTTLVAPPPSLGRATALVALNPSIKGRPPPTTPWASSDATWREALLFSSTSAGPPGSALGARPGPSYKALDDAAARTRGSTTQRTRRRREPRRR